MSAVDGLRWTQRTPGHAQGGQEAIVELPARLQAGVAVGPAPAAQRHQVAGPQARLVEAEQASRRLGRRRLPGGVCAEAT